MAYESDIDSSEQEEIESLIDPVMLQAVFDLDTHGSGDGEATSNTNGGSFTPEQYNELRHIILMARAQGRQWTFHYKDTGTEIPVDTFLTLEGGVQPTQYVLGAISHRNGFVDGYGISCLQKMDRATDAIRFVLYRNGVQSKCEFMITALDNKTHINGESGGCVRARLFNTNPGLYTIDQQNDVYPFRAQEMLTLRAMASRNPMHTFPTSVDEMILWLYPVFEIWSPDTAAAQRYGGGLVDNIPGGGEGSLGGGTGTGGGGEIGGGGEVGGGGGGVL